MSILHYSVGVDVSMDKFDVSILTVDAITRKQKTVRSEKFENNPKGIKKFVDWCHREHKQKDLPFAIVMEATGTYHERVALALHLAEFRVHIVLPNKAKAYFKAISSNSKTDKADAKALARMGAEQALTPWNPPGAFYYTLRSLTRQHQSLQGTITGLKNQIHALSFCMRPQDRSITNLQEIITMLEKTLKENKADISKHLRSDKSIWKRVQHILTIPGVGELTAATVLAETGGFELFTNVGQVVSYAGYDVIENQSGKHIGKTRISKQGNSRIRRILFMPGFATKTAKTPTIIDLYERTLGRHHFKMKSYVAIQKKLLVLIYTLWKKQEDFDPNYQDSRTSNQPVLDTETETNTTSDTEAVHSSRDSGRANLKPRIKKLALTEQG